MTNDLTPEEKELFEACIEHDIVVRMPPKREYTVKAKVTIEKGILKKGKRLKNREDCQT